MSTVDSSAFADDPNPYASPQSWQQENADRVEVLPRLAPRDLWDALITLGFVLLIIPTGCGLIAVIQYPWKTEFIPAAIFLAVLLPASLALLLSVRRLTVDQMGIQIHRRLGGPKFLHWEQIQRITLASREEVLFKGYIYPPLPAKATMNTTSYLGHYRIEWDGGTLYFPPSDAEAFLAAVGRWRSELLEQLGS